MNTATITAITTAIVSIVGAVTSLIVALRNNGKVNAIQDQVDTHITNNTPPTVVPIDSPPKP